MKNFQKIITALFVFSLISAQICLADSENRVIFYEHPNFSGHTLPIYDAGEIRDLHDKDRGATGDWNDRFSSIEFDGNFKVTLYTDEDFSGRSVTVTSSQRDMYNINGEDWNDIVSSIRWEPISPTPTVQQAIFYDDTDFHGRSFVLNVGDQIKDLTDKKRGSPVRNWNDKIRSVRLIGGADVVLYENKKFGGARKTITSNNRDLSRYNFSGRASSVKVQ